MHKSFLSLRKFSSSPTTKQGERTEERGIKKPRRLLSPTLSSIKMEERELLRFGLCRGGVLASLGGGDVILCQITSQAAGHPEAVPILVADFEPGGGLRRASFALPHRVVTANEVCVTKGSGKIDGGQTQRNPGAKLFARVESLSATRLRQRIKNRKSVL
jgi:hypothetical protein